MKISETLAKKEAEKREKVKALLAKGEAATAEELKQVDDLIVECEGLKTERAAAEKRENFEAENESALNGLKTVPANPIPFGNGGGTLGFEKEKAGEVVVDTKTRQILDEQGYGLSEKQMESICTKTYRDAFVSMLRKKGFNNLGDGDRKALTSGTDDAGGFLVPAQFMAKMVEREPAPTALASLVTMLQTASDKLILPKNTYSASDKYTTGVRVEWVDEQTGPSSESNAKDFGNITIPIHTAMMYHDVTNNMLEDSAFNILAWLQMKFRETADLTQEDMILNGSGQGRPAGLLLNPGGNNQPGTVVSGHASQVTADGLIDLAWSLLSRYKKNARFIFNSTSTGKAIAKLKDADNRYLFAAGVNSDGLATARPESLLGYPITESDFMPDVAANAFPLIFGDPKGYYFVKRVGFSIQVLNEIVATNNKVRLLGRMRIGGQPAEDWRLKVQKIST